MKSLLIVFSYHHGNTEKIARVIAKALDAQIVAPDQIHPEEVQGFDLIGLGSGIYDSKHHQSLLSFADSLPKVDNGKAFLFSTSSHIGEEQVVEDHSALRQKLQTKGYLIVGEFSCKGFNTNSFLRHFGGMNKGRPNEDDLRNAEEFARDLKKKCND